jgi:hypothetical protein
LDELLASVQLTYLVERQGGYGAEENWEDVSANSRSSFQHPLFLHNDLLHLVAHEFAYFLAGAFSWRATAPWYGQASLSQAEVWCSRSGKTKDLMRPGSGMYHFMMLR